MRNYYKVCIFLCIGKICVYLKIGKILCVLMYWFNIWGYVWIYDLEKYEVMY